MFARLRPLLGAFLLTIAVLLPQSALPARSDEPLVVVSRDGTHAFRVEIMRTPVQRARGLMHRRHLDRDAGMLFDYGRPVVAQMWMKNTYIPLDMIFIRADGTVAGIAADTVPHSLDVITAPEPVRYVLEINAGVARELGIRPGDRVDVPVP